MTVLEGRVERGGSRPPSRQDHPHGAGLGRDEVLRIVRYDIKTLILNLTLPNLEKDIDCDCEVLQSVR